MSLINREELLEFGNKNCIKTVVGNWDELDNKAKSAVLRYAQRLKGAILDAPAVDAVEVIRCKECKHFSPCGEIEGVTWTGWCNYGEFHTDEEDFCSRGERRTDES